MTERKNSGWVLWLTLGVLVPVLYVASLGPSCWLSSRPMATSVFAGVVPLPPRVMTIYWPLVALVDSKFPSGRWIYWWMLVGIPEDRCVVMPISVRGNLMTFCR